MLMIQMMLGYEGSLQVTNGQRGTERHYKVASGPGSGWQVGLDELVGLENEIRRACWDKLSGEFEIE